MKTNIYDIRIGNNIPNIITNSNFSIDVWFTGCSLNCKNCHNKELQKEGFYLDLEHIKEYIQARKALSEWVCFLGGEPLNSFISTFILYDLLLFSKDLGLKTFIFTGYSNYFVEKRVYDFLSSHDLFRYVDYIKCGNYDERHKDDDYAFGSLNQILYTGKGKKVYWHDFEECKTINQIN